MALPQWITQPVGWAAGAAGTAYNYESVESPYVATVVKAVVGVRVSGKKEYNTIKVYFQRAKGSIPA